ncbi:MAG TPA: hypothetical protein VKB26_09645 [Candidatus Acidoferrales bacterium]|nr:hypothetical protein [Candidatus Acidoferrales bacterium]
MKTTKPLLEYLATCSKISLESFELARLNDRANLRKRMIELMDELVEVDIQARIAEWILVHRRSQAAIRRRSPRNTPTALKDSSLPLLTSSQDRNEDGCDLPLLGPNPVIRALRRASIESPTPVSGHVAPITEKSRRIA